MFAKTLMLAAPFSVGALHVRQYDRVIIDDFVNNTSFVQGNGNKQYNEKCSSDSDCASGLDCDDNLKNDKCRYKLSQTCTADMITYNFGGTQAGDSGVRTCYSKYQCKDISGTKTCKHVTDDFDTLRGSQGVSKEKYTCFGTGDDWYLQYQATLTNAELPILSVFKLDAAEYKASDEYDNHDTADESRACEEICKKLKDHCNDSTENNKCPFKLNRGNRTTTGVTQGTFKGNAFKIDSGETGCVTDVNCDSGTCSGLTTTWLNEGTTNVKVGSITLGTCSNSR